MHVTGEAEVPNDAPCHACGGPLSDGSGTPDLSAIFCPSHAILHPYHTACLPPDLQVELMLAKMRHQGMIE